MSGGGGCLQRLGRQDRKCAERWESSQKAPEINGNAAKWRKERLQMSHHEETVLSVFLKIPKRVWVRAAGCMCAFSAYLLLCKHVSVCVCPGVTGGRYAMSWLTRVLLCCSVLHDWPSAVRGQPPSPLTLGALTRMPAHTYLTHTCTQTDSRTHPIMRTKTDSVMHRLVACNWIGTSSVIFPIWWPDAPQWRGICSLVPCHGAVWVCSQRETWLEGFRGARTPPPPCCTQAFSQVSRTRCPRARSSVTLPNNNTLSTPWLFTFWKG